MPLRKRKHTHHSILIINLLQYTQTTSQDCNPCLAASDNSFKVKPGTNCKEYAQCVNGKVASEFICQGDTVYDELGQYCNWPDSTTCVETGCSPTSSPMDGVETTGMNETVTESDDCPNPCFGTTSGFKTIPGTNCKTYVQCSDGKVYSPELQCEGDTIFNQAGGYCDWITSVTCEPAPCPQTPAPSASPDATGMPSAKPEAPTEEPSLAPVVSPTTITPTVASNNQSLSSPPTAENITLSLSPTPSSSTNSTPQSVLVNCSNPCPSGFIGFQVRPNTDCTKYVQCNDGTVVKEYQCPSGTMFFEENAGCRTVDESGSVGTDLWSVQGTNLCPDVICSDDSSSLSTTYPSSSSSSTEPPVSVTAVPLVSPQTTSEPTTPPQPVTKPVSIYENLRKYLYQRQEMLDAIVFLSLYGPSVEYTLEDLMNSLN
ncbi:hypothetical protein ACHAW6_011821, partial [Cyclotella cf. meneghiniana]